MNDAEMLVPARRPPSLGVIPARVLRSLAGILLAVAAAGCQGMMPDAQQPSPTTILLPFEAVEEQAETPAATRSPAPATTISATARPERTPLPAIRATPEPEGVPVRIMALGVKASLDLRSEPSAGAPIIARIPGSDVLWAEGRSTDGRWLWVVAAGSDTRGWLPATAVDLFGDPAALPTTDQAVALPPATAGAPVSAGAPAATRAPALAPRMTGKIAFQAASGGAIYLIGADGTGLRRVADGLDPALSPDGARLAYARWGVPNGIFVLDLQTGQEQIIAAADRPRSPTWSSDGTKLAFVRLLEMVTCRESPFGCLEESALRARFGGRDCILSPTGRVCIQDFPLRQVERNGIVQVGADGQGWLDVGASADAQSVWWRPGRDELLYRGDGGLQIAGADRAPVLLVRNAALSGPVWSTDGQRIAVQVRLHDHSDIFLLDPAGQTSARLTATPSGAGRSPNNVAPTWSPDGTQLLFLSDRDGAWRLYRMNADGSGHAPFAPAAMQNIELQYAFAAERVASWSR